MMLPILSLSVAGVAAYWYLRTNRKPKRDIRDEAVVIIGASSGVGLETARLYARSWQEHPHRILHIVARRAEIQKVEDELVKATGCTHMYAHVADAVSTHDLAALAHTVRQTCGKVDTLIYW